MLEINITSEIQEFKTGIQDDYDDDNDDDDD